MRLHSAPLFNTPRLIKWARNGFRSPSKKDRDMAMAFLVDCYRLPRFVAWGVLDGCVPYTVEGDVVVLTVDISPTS